jgi:hypothetical protein
VSSHAPREIVTPELIRKLENRVAHNARESEHRPGLAVDRIRGAA